MSFDMLAVLQDLNFTEYEAKVYLTLLREFPLTGYAVARNSGVPRSKVYEVLAGLVDRGDVLISHETPALYSPLPTEELLTRRRRKAEESFTTAEQALERYSNAGRNRDNIWNITGREAILGRVREVLRSAKSRIMAELWPEEVEVLSEDLRAAAKRGVTIIIVAYGKVECDFASVYPHDASHDITTEYGGRWVVVSVDDREVVAGTVSLGDDSRAAWTTHPGLAIPITEIIVHDLYIWEILDRHRDVVEASFGPNLIELRKRFNVDPSGSIIADKLR